MPYIIDGHNLIGTLPDIHLSDLDDEDKLIERLRAFSRSSRKQVEVYFDRAAPGRAGRFRYGSVTAVFVATGKTADDAIRHRLGQLGKSAANWTVVSSDRAVASEAGAARARVMSAGEFAGVLQTARPGKGPDRDPELGEGELAEWLRLFGDAEDD